MGKKKEVLELYPTSQKEKGILISRRKFRRERYKRASTKKRKKQWPRPELQPRKRRTKLKGGGCTLARRRRTIWRNKKIVPP